MLAEAREGSLYEGRYGIYVWPIDALRAADAVTTLRYALNPVARDHGLQISLMPQATTEGGSLELRVHQTLVDRATGQNVLVEPTDKALPVGDSPLHRFIGGQLRHASAMAAVLAPGVNAYKRAAVAWRVGWGHFNRYTLLRVARAALPDRNRVEVRGADPSCNPYLALATLLSCGLDGLRDGRYVVDAVDETRGRLTARDSTWMRCRDRCVRRWTRWPVMVWCAALWAVDQRAFSRPAASNGPPIAAR